MEKFITHKEFAKLLGKRQYRNEVSKEEIKNAFKNGLVIVFGASDDLIEFEGAIVDELGASNNDVFNINKKSLKIQNSKKGKNIIKVFWDNKELDSYWNYSTSIPHSNFYIYRDDGLYCIGFVFSIYDLK